jgi:cobalt-precorrin 5A hydrolase
LSRGGLKRLVRAAFDARSDILFITASGIAVRSVAPFLRGKHLDPAVVAMDEGGGFVISLLSGHLGGANRLARELAAFFGATPVITTATDVAGLPCVEDLAERFSLAIDDVRKIKAINSAVLKGEKVPVIDRDPKRRKEAGLIFGASFRFVSRLPERLDKHRAFVMVSSRTGVVPAEIKRKTLVLRPREFAVGVGCRRGVTVEEVSTAISKALKDSGVSPLSIKNLATIDIKKDEEGLTGFAARAGVPMEFFTAAELNTVKPPSGRSRMVEEKTGAGGVSEPAALLSAGVKRLWLKKRIFKRVTVAVARVPSL